MLRVLFFCLLTAIFLPLGHAEQANAAAKADSPKSDPAAADYVLQPLDFIRVKIFREDNLSNEYRISQDGTVTMPLIGSVDLKYKSVRYAENLIRKLYDADYLVNPQVTVTVLEYAERRVEVYGSVANPGLVLFPKEQGLTLTEAISKAGSLNRLANKKGIMIRRTMPDGEIKTIGPINMDDLIKGDGANYPLQPGDVINVPERLL